MILYHGSDVEVKNPKIIKSEKGRDFGCAFYLTPIKEQSERMAKRKQRMNKSISAIVSVFEFNEKEVRNLKSKSFKNPDLEWLDMIIECRTNPSFIHGYDIVEGKINLNGIILNITDTAGIRKTDNIVEKIGVEKSLNIINKSDLIILMLNNNESLTVNFLG